MNKIAIFILIFIFGLVVQKNVFSAPNNAAKAENNPNVVAYYPEGLHAIPTDPVTYFTGSNMVTRRGNTGQIQAWYSNSEGRGFHSVWNVTKKDECPNNWVYFSDPYPEWGDYLTEGASYCVHVNPF